jgi:hypothetical protein
MDLAITIRTLVTTDDTVHVQAGCGVVADSDRDAEYQETLNKARAVLGALAMARTADTPDPGQARVVVAPDDVGPAAGPQPSHREPR